MDAAGVRILARPREVAREIEMGGIFRPVNRFERNVRKRTVDRARAGPLTRLALFGSRFPALVLLLELRGRLGAQTAGALDHLGQVDIPPNRSASTGLGQSPQRFNAAPEGEGCSSNRGADEPRGLC